MLARVTSVQEEAGPLGGISHVYTIEVKSADKSCNLDYTICRTFSEFSDMHGKLQRQFPKTFVPPLSKHLSGQSITCEERMNALDTLMAELSSNSSQMNSSLIDNFLQLNKNRMLQAEKKLSAASALPTPKVSMQKEETPPQKVEKEDELLLSDDYMQEYAGEPERVNIDIKPKSKVQPKKESNFRPTTPLKEPSHEKPSKEVEYEDVDLFLPSTEATVVGADIFDEFKPSNTSQNKLNVPTKTNLFDDYDDDGQDLFKVEENPKNKEVAQKQLPLSSHLTEVFQVPKTAKINLFEDLDLGDRVLKDEQHLFFIPDKVTEEKSPSNLTAEDEDAKKLLDVDDSLNDIFDLLKVENDGSATTTVPKTFSKPVPPARTKPVPAPRRPLPAKEDAAEEVDTESSDEKPKPAPNTPFAAKPEKPPKPPRPSKPTVPSKPMLKPSVPSKPMQKKPVPPRPARTMQPQPVEGGRLSHVDINQYISQQSSASEEVDLFG